MTFTVDKKIRFELLLKQTDLPLDWTETYFQETYINKVICSENNNHWSIHLSTPRVFPVDVYQQLVPKIKHQFSKVAHVDVILNFSQSTPRDIAEEYWELFQSWLIEQEPTCNGWITKSKISVVQKELELNLFDAFSLEQAKKKHIDQFIRKFFYHYFLLDLSVLFVTRESIEEELGEFAKQIEKEEKAVLQQLVNDKNLSSHEQQSRFHSLIIGNSIKEEAIKLSDIQEEHKKITVQGQVFKFETKELKNGTQLISFCLTDFSDSFMLKLFAKTKEELKSYQMIHNGMWLKCKGKIEYDRFSQPPELIMIPSDIEEIVNPYERFDYADVKRVEFHLHSNMSTMDGISPIDAYIQQAKKWGHQAIAITDHHGIQAFPDASKAAKKQGIKMIYGVEAQIINDSVPIVLHATNENFDDATYVVFDIETTGLSIKNHKIIEIAAIKLKHGKEIARFESFINPNEKIPYAIQQLTHITDQMVTGAPEIQDKLPEFVSFVHDSILVAHNAKFDMGFIQANLKKYGFPELKNTVLDTLEFARFLFPNLKNHRLNTIADKYKVALDQHHRAIYDTIALGSILIHMLEDAKQRNILSFNTLNNFTGKDLSNQKPFHCCIYAQNSIGKKNLYTLISLSHTIYFQKIPCIPKSLLMDYREGLIISSGCEKGELFETVLNKSNEEAELIADFYDVLEVQPVDYSIHLVEKGFVENKKILEQVVIQICEIGKKLNKPVIATGNVHYLQPQDKIFRDITIHGITGFSPLKEMKKPNAYLLTTQEMLDEFQFLDENLAYQIVVENTNMLANQFESIQLFPDQLYAPIIEGADDEIRTKCYDKARSIYGHTLPQVVSDRLEKELQPIIKYGFSAIYLISERLVKKSNQDGYLVGSRGSVGSSVVAMMLGISEVNPLPAHYICSSCQYSRWFLDGSVPSGFDLPKETCPSCGHALQGDGHDIPFETFLGFAGDKVPDIDLNFSGEYQVYAHQYTKQLFGEKNVFRAGTIGTVADRTAFGFVKKFEEDHGKQWRTAEVYRLSEGCTGVKRSTGQHPGGIVVVPEYIDVNEITPVQFPADDKQSDWQTTHFDYHAFDANLLKLDILGHDDPTMMKMLQDLTKVDPQTIPMNDPKVMSIFHSTDAIGVKGQQIRSGVATYGIPEMGTKFVRQMLEETNPSSFADLLQISGLSHGTGVWLGNAQDLIRKKICTIKTVIGCRDDIMLYLIYKAGMDASLAFKITESVRKGKGLTDEWKNAMKSHHVPDWYIDSCERIEYMFPKAHATAYVISAVRTAYYKVYYPVEFYAAYFSIRVQDFDLDVLCQGYDMISKKLIEIEEKNFQATAKEKNMVSILEVALEMSARGFSFKPVDLYLSEASRFVIDGKSIIAPFSAVAGIGENASRLIVQSRDDGPYLSIEDFQNRAKVSKTVIDVLTTMGCFRELPDSNQLSLF